MYCEDLKIVELIVRHPVETFLYCDEFAVGWLRDPYRGHCHGTQRRGYEELPLTKANLTF